MKSFLREYAIYNLAKFMADTEAEMIEASLNNGNREFLQDKSTLRTSALAFSYKDLFTCAPGDEDEAGKAFIQIMEREGGEPLQQFKFLKAHYSSVHKIIKDFELEGSPADQKDRVRTSKAHLKGAFVEGMERAVKLKSKIDKERNGIYWKPKVLVLQGGGAKGMSYAGVIQAMEDAGQLKNIEMVAGTSAGALMGLMVAMGFTGEEINDVVEKGRFAHFFAESTLKFKNLMKIKELFVKTAPEETPHFEGDLLVEFSNNYFMPALAEATGISVKRWSRFPEAVVQEYLSDLEKGRYPAVNDSAHSIMWGKSIDLQQIFIEAQRGFIQDLTLMGRAKDAAILRFEGTPGRSRAFQAALTCIRYERPNSLEDGDTIEAFLGDVIQQKIKDIPISILRRVNPPIVSIQEMRSLSFSQLKQLQTMYPPANLKEFGVAATVSYMPFSLGNIVQLAGRAIEKGREWISGAAKDTGVGERDANFTFKPIFFRAYEEKEKAKQSNMSIKKAVRASMNLPFLFEAMNINGKRVVDGGINSNFPFRMFADRFKSPEEANEAMIGFMLSTVESDIEMKAISDLVHSENSVLMDIIESEFLDTPKSKPFTHAMMHPISHFSKVFKKFVADKVEAFMVTNNALPSIEALDNIGIINSGMIGTAQFNATLKERRVLASQGANAYLDLTCFHFDKKLRFAMGRLVSLSTIENKLLDEKGLPVDLQDPIYRLRDPDLLADCLSHERYNESELDHLIMKKQEIVVGGLPPHLTHFATELSYR
jgi:predicted acylesterase/phospholipase RssA